MTKIDQSYDPAVPIDTLTPHPLNPRQGDIGAIHQSITANGFYGAVIVQKSTGYIIAGNHRWKAAQHAGMTTIPAHVIDVDDDRARRILLADNRTNDLASYDDSALLDILQDLRTETGTLAGVWTIGPHRLIIGDATDPNVYTRLDVDQVDMVWTDPPYGVGYQSSGRDPERSTNIARAGSRTGPQHRVLAGDDMTHDDLEKMLRDAFQHAFDLTKPGGAWYVTSPPGQTLGVFARVLTDLNVWRHSIIWAKDTMVFGRSDYHYQHEPMFYGWKPGAAHFFTDDRTQTSVWNIDRPTKSDHHPTMKPVELIARAIKNSTRPGETILDPFTGSGTTLIAAHQKDRIGIGIELHPAYAAVTLQRLADEGLTPERIDPT